MLLRRHHSKPKEPEKAPVAVHSEAKSYKDKTVSELREMAKKQSVEGYSVMKKSELLEALGGE